MLTLALAGLAAAATQTALRGGVSVAFGREVHVGVEALAMVRLFDRSDTKGFAGVDAVWWITRPLYAREGVF